MNKKIENEQTKVKEGISINDKDCINSLLTTLKELSKNYVISMTEASNEQLFQEYFNTFDDIISLQREVYEVMFRNGWYSLDVAPNNSINEKLTKIKQEITSLK